MVVFIQTTAERAAITAQQNAFLEQLVGGLLDLTPESIECKDGYPADALFRTLFFKIVFPAYIERIFSGSGFFVSQPILECVVGVYRDLRFRFGFWTQEYLEPFTASTLGLLAAAKSALTSTSPEHILTSPQKLRAYNLLFCALLEILCRCQEMEYSFGSFGNLPDVWEYLLYFYKNALMIAFRPPRLLPEELLDDDGQDVDASLPEPQLSAVDARILAYARKELGEALDRKWICDGGRWYVLRAAGRREQVLGGAVGSIDVERQGMQAAAERFVTAFAALWNAQ